jgi:hypothetical protein
MEWIYLAHDSVQWQADMSTVTRKGGGNLYRLRDF